jgi:pimeloyl-ACP methyl ester carboxylesterase
MRLNGRTPRQRTVVPLAVRRGNDRHLGLHRCTSGGTSSKAGSGDDPTTDTPAGSWQEGSGTTTGRKQITRRHWRAGKLAAVLAAATAAAITTPVGAAAAAVAGPPDPAGQTQYTRFYRQPVTWRACTTPESAKNLDCTRVTVPVDWAKPDGATLTLAVARHRATGTRRGALFLNPGGPGGSGVGFVPDAVQSFDSSLVAAYDLISWDPRGVGGSTPVNCPTLVGSGSDEPDTPHALDAYLKARRHDAAACRRRVGPVLGHVDTLSTVRDLDVLRAALGEDKLNFFGFSYGTRIGAWYADTFPDQVGRMVLDSALDPALDAAGWLDGTGKGLERAYGSYLARCRARSTCPFRQVSAAQARKQTVKLVAALNRRPLKVPGVAITGDLTISLVGQLLYDPTAWPAIDAMLAGAMRRDAGPTVRILQALASEPDGLDSAAYTAIECLDVPDRRSATQVLADAAQLRRRYPIFGNQAAFSPICTDWPVPPVMTPRAVSADGAAAILVVGTVNDPATPYEWSQALAAELSSSRLLTYAGDGHAAYQRKNPCERSAVDTYLLDGTLPEAATVCAA